MEKLWTQPRIITQITSVCQSNKKCRCILKLLFTLAVVCYRPKFRSYKPEDESLKANVVGDAQPGDIRAEVKDQLESASSSVVIDELDITNLAPRKPDWDLKRDVAKKLNKLERRTQRAIAELIRDRLKQRQEDLANIVTSGAAPEKR